MKITKLTIKSVGNVAKALKFSKILKPKMFLKLRDIPRLTYFLHRTGGKCTWDLYRYLY